MEPQIFERVYPEVLELCRRLGIERSEAIAKTLAQLWLPLALELARERDKLGRTLVQGILGGQGTGKTTLSRVLGLILYHLGYSLVGLSIDDLYKTHAQRQKLKAADPRFKWRGPPGTHDIALGIEILDAIRQPNPPTPIFIPRFDKSLYGGDGDRIEPEKVEKIDILIFEGWFVGVRPIAAEAFDSPPYPIVTPEDKQFARDINERLRDYLPLWERLDRLLVLYPVDYRLCKEWRKEAERQAIASGKSGISDAEIEAFVEYFWKALHPELFITPLTQNPDLVDLVVEIDRDRTIGRCYR